MRPRVQGGGLRASAKVVGGSDTARGSPSSRDAAMFLFLQGCCKGLPFLQGCCSVPLPPAMLQRAPLSPGLAGVMLRNRATASPGSCEQTGQRMKNLSGKRWVEGPQTKRGEGREERGAAICHLPSAAAR